MAAVNDAADDTGSVPYIAHGEFRNRLPHGGFRVVINPALARPFVVQRLRINLLAVVVITVGAALALVGHPLPGLVMVGLGMVVHRLVRQQAGKIVLHLALNSPAVYAQVTSNGVMEVRRAV